MRGTWGSRQPNAKLRHPGSLLGSVLTPVCRQLVWTGLNHNILCFFFFNYILHTGPDLPQHLVKPCVHLTLDSTLISLPFCLFVCFLSLSRFIWRHTSPNPSHVLQFLYLYSATFSDHVSKCGSLRLCGKSWRIMVKLLKGTRGFSEDTCRIL